MLERRLLKHVALCFDNKNLGIFNNATTVTTSGKNEQVVKTNKCKNSYNNLQYLQLNIAMLDERRLMTGSVYIND